MQPSAAEGKRGQSHILDNYFAITNQHLYLWYKMNTQQSCDSAKQTREMNTLVNLSTVNLTINLTEV